MPPVGRQAALAKRRDTYRKRSLGRKASLVALRGGCCSQCGYDTSIRALHFHHRDPADKTPAKNQRSTRFNAAFLAEREWPPDEAFWDEFWACDLLCANCHMETEEQEKHGTTDWKSHIDPSIYAGLTKRNAGMASSQDSDTASQEAASEVADD